MTATTKMHEDVRLEHICSYWATVTQPEVIAPLPEGIRINVYVTAGEMAGPRLRGRFGKGGGDWLLLRSDGIGVLDVRATVETDDGALIYMTYGGIAELGADGFETFRAGTPPPRVQLRIAPRFCTGHPNYLWLNRLQCVGIGEVDMQQMRVSYDIYAIG